MSENATEWGSARFFDKHRRDLGWASRVAMRGSALSRLTVFDVMDAQPELAGHLKLLDESPLVVQYTDEQGACYRFRWASGYPNGDHIRIQGMLEHP
jgi:hypothetical protein